MRVTLDRVTVVRVTQVHLTSVHLTSVFCNASIVKVVRLDCVDVAQGGRAQLNPTLRKVVGSK